MNEMILSELAFQLEREDSNGTLLNKANFPVVVPPKEPQTFSGNNIVTVSKNVNGETVTAKNFATNNNISRPRNKFILARNILSKVVKNCENLSTDDTSRIVSKVCIIDEPNGVQLYHIHLSNSD